MAGKRGLTLSERFWSKVDIKATTDCWEWQASLKETVSGGFKVGAKAYQAHRLAWILTYGEIPDGLLVCHKCDNGKCCNPNHLFLGTHKDNTQDMIRKGRKPHLYGDTAPHRKLNTSDVLLIRDLYQQGVFLQKELATIFGVLPATISAVITGRNWGEVK